MNPNINHHTNHEKEKKNVRAQIVVSGRAKRTRKRNPKTEKPKKSEKTSTKRRGEMDIYSTVWLSDFESIKSVGSKSFNTSASSSSSMSFNESINMSHSTPRKNGGTDTNQTVNLPLYHGQQQKRNKVLRTLSLPELQMSTLTGNDLTERFIRLQLEQDNRDLQSMVETLQGTIDRVKTSVFPYEAECCHECVDSKNTLDSILYELSRSIYHKKQSNEGGGLKIPYYERSESGYSTLQHDSSFYRTPSLDSHHINDSQLLSSKEEYKDEEYLQSRLVSRRRLSPHDASCCMVQ